MKKVPENVDLLNQLSKIKHKWYKLGHSFQVEENVLESLQNGSKDIKN